jgi:hypothetical protein
LARAKTHFCWSICARQMVSLYRASIDRC